jgi:hypothetical protein
LDACFKGCGNAFHDMMATKDLLDVVVRIVVTETLQARLPALHSALHCSRVSIRPCR